MPASGVGAMRPGRAYDIRARRRSLVVLLILVAITLGYLALDRLAGGPVAAR